MRRKFWLCSTTTFRARSHSHIWDSWPHPLFSRSSTWVWSGWAHISHPDIVSVAETALPERDSRSNHCHECQWQSQRLPFFSTVEIKVSSKEKINPYTRGTRMTLNNDQQGVSLGRGGPGRGRGGRGLRPCAAPPPPPGGDPAGLTERQLTIARTVGCASAIHIRANWSAYATQLLPGPCRTKTWGS